MGKVQFNVAAAIQSLKKAQINIGDVITNVKKIQANVGGVIQTIWQNKVLDTFNLYANIGSVVNKINKTGTLLLGLTVTYGCEVFMPVYKDGSVHIGTVNVTKRTSSDILVYAISTGVNRFNTMALDKEGNLWIWCHNYYKESGEPAEYTYWMKKYSPSGALLLNLNIQGYIVFIDAEGCAYNYNGQKFNAPNGGAYLFTIPNGNASYTDFWMSLDAYLNVFSVSGNMYDITAVKTLHKTTKAGANVFSYALNTAGAYYGFRRIKANKDGSRVAIYGDVNGSKNFIELRNGNNGALIKSFNFPYNSGIYEAFGWDRDCYLYIIDSNGATTTTKFYKYDLNGNLAYQGTTASIYGIDLKMEHGDFGLFPEEML